jgi:hypothetical protein
MLTSKYGQRKTELAAAEAEVVERQPIMALSSNPSVAKKEKKRKIFKHYGQRKAQGGDRNLQMKARLQHLFLRVFS